MEGGFGDEGFGITAPSANGLCGDAGHGGWVDEDAVLNALANGSYIACLGGRLDWNNGKRATQGQGMRLPQHLFELY